MGQDIMDAAAALAEHQESFRGKHQVLDNTASVIYHASEDIPSTGNVIEDISTGEIERSSENDLRQIKGNVEIGDQFLGEEAANNRNNCTDQSTNTMVIRSVALGHKGKIVL